jgi:hypothetical protein
MPTPPTNPGHTDDPCLLFAYIAHAQFLQLDPHQLEILNGGQAYKAVHPDSGCDVEYPKLLCSSDGLLWEEPYAEKAGCLAQGYKQAKGTNTIHFIRNDQIPKGCRATYLGNVVADRPQKEQPRRVRWTVGGNLIDYPGDVSTTTARLTTAKLLFNSVLSTPNTKFMTMDTKDFYLNNPMDRYEYMMITVSLIPKAIFDQYNLSPLVHNGYVYVKIHKGMYGLPQAGQIANDALVPYLPTHGYGRCTHTPGLFKHSTRPVMFSLVADNFGVQYVGHENAQHLANIIAAKYKMTTDWTGNLYVGINLKWDYTACTVDFSMPGYIAKALQQFKITPTT